MSYTKTVIENQHKLYSLGEQEGYRKMMQIKNNGKILSNYDLTPSTAAGSISNEFTAKYAYYKDFFTGSPYSTSMVDIDFIVSGMVAGRTAIVIDLGSVAKDSSGLEPDYIDDKGVISNYNYVNNGDEEFDETNCVYGKISSTKVINVNGNNVGYVCKPFKGSDNKYITGSIVRNDIKPIGGRNEWYEIPSELEGKEYIVFPGSNYPSAEISFVANAESYNNSGFGCVRVYMFCISPLTFDSEWTQVEMSAKTRYQNYIDNLNIAYMISNGYITESDIVTTDNKYRCRRWDALYNLFKDCGNVRGFSINPNRASKTGFDITPNNHSYKEYSDSWIPYPCDADYIINNFQIKNETDE